MREGTRIAGRGAAPGIALGPAYVHRRPGPGADDACGLPGGGGRGPQGPGPQATGGPHETARLRAAVETARERTHVLRDRAAQVLGPAEAGIFEAQLLMLDDPDLIAAAEEGIAAGLVSAEEALQQAGAASAAALRAIPDEHLQARAADVEDVVNRVLDVLGQRPLRSLPAFAEPVVIVAHELLPSDMVTLERDKVLGLVTQTGSPTSHAAILARNLGLPAVVGAPLVCELVRGGDLVAADGGTGEIVVRPGLAEAEAWRARQTVWEGRRRGLLADAHLPAETTDGHRVRVAANIGAPGEAEAAASYGAEGVGLFRTEFLFIGRDDLPGEDEQFEAYRLVIRRLAPWTVVIRTIDVGGDKLVGGLSDAGPTVRGSGAGLVGSVGAGVPVGVEANPFLGVRGIRLALRQEDMFLTQLRAILRAAAEVQGGPSPGDAGRAEVRVMFPMVADIREVRAAKALLGTAVADLDARGVKHGPVKVGIMVEVPSAAILIDTLLPEVDFVSIGTNDLAQYTMAADRMNAAVADLADALSPAVLRLIATVGEAGRRAGKPVAVCGDLAGNPLAAPVLVGLGVDELSAAPPLVPEVKLAVRGFSLPAAEALARRVLGCATAEEVRHEIERARSGRQPAEASPEGPEPHG